MAAAASIHGKVCLVTGATSGIGFVTAQALAQQGATVVLVGRDPHRGAAAVDRLTRETGNDAVSLVLADLSSQAQIAQLAQEFHDHFDRLDVLVNNAGALFARRQLSIDGIEMTLALNHLGYFLLTRLLLDTIKASPYARIVNVASGAHRAGHIDFDDLQGERRYGGWRAYSQSKLANIVFTYELAARLEGTGVTVNAMHPGFVATHFGHNNSGPFAWLIRVTQVAALSPQQGAETIIYLATSPDVADVTGRYYIKKRAVRSSQESYDKSIAKRLWQISEELIDL